MPWSIDLIGFAFWTFENKFNQSIITMFIITVQIILRGLISDCWPSFRLIKELSLSLLQNITTMFPVFHHRHRHCHQYHKRALSYRASHRQRHEFVTQNFGFHLRWTVMRIVRTFIADMVLSKYGVRKLAPDLLPIEPRVKSNGWALWQAALLQFYIATILHCCIAILLHYYFVTLLHCYITLHY